MQQQTTLADKIIAKYNLYELVPRSPEPKIYFNERIKLALEDYAIQMNNPDTEDVVINLFSDKYTTDVKFKVLATLENNKELLIGYIKQYHPEYYISKDIYGEECVAKFNLILDVKNNFPKFKYEHQIIK